MLRKPEPRASVEMSGLVWAQARAVHFSTSATRWKKRPVGALEEAGRCYGLASRSGAAGKFARAAGPRPPSANVAKFRRRRSPRLLGLRCGETICKILSGADGSGDGPRRISGSAIGGDGKCGALRRSGERNVSKIVGRRGTDGPGAGRRNRRRRNCRASEGSAGTDARARGKMRRRSGLSVKFVARNVRLPGPCVVGGLNPDG